MSGVAEPAALAAEGPTLESLVRRLADSPADFLAPPRIAASGTVYVAAVVSDLLLDMGGAGLAPEDAAPFAPGDLAEGNRLRTVLVACWLLAHEGLLAASRAAPEQAVPAILAFVHDDLAALAALAPADQWVRDGERREELARLALRALGLRPRGESLAQAQDRLLTVSSVERNRVIAAARAAEERSQAIRAAMAKKAAEEAAAKYSRE